MLSSKERLFDIVRIIKKYDLLRKADNVKKQRRNKK